MRLKDRLIALPGPRRAPGRALAPCPLCGDERFDVLGVRGNREHTGADPSATPHLWTHVVRCARCDFVYANPPLPEAQALEAAHYASAESYEASDEAGRTRAMFRDRIALIARHAPRGRLFDVGTGKGEFLAEAASAGYQVSGTEPSAGLAAFASERTGALVHHGLLSDAPVADGSFDVITLNHVLEHVARPLDLLADVRRKLAPSGVAFVEVPNSDAHLALLADVYFRLRRRDWSSRLSPVHPPFHSYGYTARSLRWALERSGFRVLEMATRSGRDRGLGANHDRATRAIVHAAFRGLSLLGNRELLLAVATPR